MQCRHILKSFNVLTPLNLLCGFVCALKKNQFDSQKERYHPRFKQLRFLSIFLISKLTHRPNIIAKLQMENILPCDTIIRISIQYREGKKIN